MDLTAAHDHPCVILRRNAAELGEEHPFRARGYADAATKLMAYEIQNEVTFAALDDDALSELYAAWELDEDDDRRAYVLEAVGKLFGLE